MPSSVTASFELGDVVGVVGHRVVELPDVAVVVCDRGAIGFFRLGQGGGRQANHQARCQDEARRE